MKHEVFNKYVDKVCKVYRLDRKELFLKTKKQEVVDARFMLYYLCAKRPMQIAYIQKYMLDNGYDINHSSIIRAIKVMETKLSEDADYVSVIQSIESGVYI
jgi:chromosomal replication initiation ATPase DnaA